MPYDVAILIVTYNSESQIRGCLSSVIAQRDHVNQQVIVLDNASTDRTVEVIREEFPEVQLVTPGRNLGFAAGVNQAASHADADFLLLLNPDTEILDHAIDVIVDFARANPKNGLYGGRTLRPDGGLEPSSCWGAPTLWSLAMFALGLTSVAPTSPWLNPEGLGTWKRDTVREVGVITGCFLLVHVKAWRELRGFDERYFMYGEDVDLALRARRLGYRPIVCPDAKLIHEVGQSSARPIDKMLLLYRGKVQLARTNWENVTLKIALMLLTAGVGIRMLISKTWAVCQRDRAMDRWTQLWERRSEWEKGYELSRPGSLGR